MKRKGCAVGRGMKAVSVGAVPDAAWLADDQRLATFLAFPSSHILNGISSNESISRLLTPLKYRDSHHASRNVLDHPDAICVWQFQSHRYQFFLRLASASSTQIQGFILRNVTQTALQGTDWRKFCTLGYIQP